MTGKIKYWLKHHRRILLISLIAILIIDIMLLFLLDKEPEKKPAASVETASQTTTAVPDVTITAAQTDTAEEQSTAATESVEKEIKIDTEFLPYYKAAAVYSLKDGKMLFEDNIYEHTAPASLTKLLTASVALKHAAPDDLFTAGSELAYVHEYSSLAGLAVGDTFTLKDLISGMLLMSGNDAAHTVAVSAARSAFPDAGLNDFEAIEAFCGLMNTFAREIGMEDSNFVSPDGWDDDEQYTTVHDLITLTEYTMSVPEIRDIVGTAQTTVTTSEGKVFTWQNSNQLLDPYGDYYHEKAIGVKTGTTLYAGNCLIAAFENNGDTYITVVVGCNTDEERYEATIGLIDQII